MTELLLRLGVDASATDNKGESPLFCLTRSCKETIPIVKVLLQSGASMEAKHRGDTLLHRAVGYGMSELVKLLVEEHGVDVNAVNHEDQTSFCIAVKCAAPIELIKFLIERGADTTMRGKRGRHARLCMVQTATADTIRVVLENVANRREVMRWKSLKDGFKNGWKQSMLHAALDRKSQEIVDLMIQFGGHEGYLANTKGGCLRRGAITGRIYLMQSVLDEGKSLDADRNRFGRTALFVAVDVRATASIDWLLKKGASANEPESNRKSLGYTPLHHAASRNSTAAVELLLKHGAKVGQRTNSGETALHMAVRHGNTQIVKMLLKSGASIRDKGSEDLTPVQLASKYYPETVLPLLTEKAGKSNRRSTGKKKTRQLLLKESWGIQ